MTRLRLAAITPLFPTSAEPYRGIYCYNTVRGMLTSADVHTFCTVARYPVRRLFRPRSFRYHRVDMSKTVTDVPLTYAPYRAVPLVTRPFNAWLCERALLRAAIRDYHPDAILGFWLYPDGFAAVRVARRIGVPAVVVALGSDLRLISDRVTRHFTRLTLQQANRVVTVSAELRDYAVRLGAPESKTLVVGNGCDLSVFHPGDRAAVRTQLGLPKACDLVVFVGWLAPLKGVRELLAAVAIAALRRPDIRLVCIGEGDLKPQLLARSAQPDLAGRAIFTGACTPAEVARWLVAADVFCLPSYSEGCPNVVLEALACGRPVVASAIGGIPEMVDCESGILVPPRDTQHLASALLAALSTPWDEAVISTKASRTWTTVGGELVDICAATRDEAARFKR